MYLSISFFQVRVWYDYLPILASLIDGYSLTLSKKYVTVGAVVSYSLWVIYNIFILSYAGLVFDGIIVISNVFILITHINKYKKIYIKGKKIRV